MDDQEIFDTVARHLLTQKAKSMAFSEDGSDISCAYRGPNGLKCAVGILIKDEFFIPAINTLSVSDNAVRYAVEKSIGGYIPILLIRALQAIHDLREVDKWKDELIALALVNDLSHEVCNAF